MIALTPASLRPQELDIYGFRFLITSCTTYPFESETKVEMELTDGKSNMSLSTYSRYLTFDEDEYVTYYRKETK